jgi:NADH-quinone oxidoreductase subunit L
VGQWAYGIGAAAALGTAFYMSRLYFLTFFGKPRTHAAEHAHESSPVMTVPLMVLALLAVVALVLALPGSMLYEHYMDPVFRPATQRLLAVQHFHEGAHPAWPYFAAWGIAALGTAIAWAMYAGPWLAAPANLARRFAGLYRFTYDKFKVDELYEAVVIEPTRYLAYVLWRVVDVFAIDGLLVNGAARVVAFIGGVARLSQNGDVQRYAAIMAVAAAVILWSVMGVGGSLP